MSINVMPWGERGWAELEWVFGLAFWSANLPIRKNISF